MFARNHRLFGIAAVVSVACISMKPTRADTPKDWGWFGYLPETESCAPVGNPNGVSVAIVKKVHYWPHVEKILDKNGKVISVVLTWISPFTLLPRRFDLFPNQRLCDDFAALQPKAQHDLI